MPREITKFPDSNDPRDHQWLPTGFAPKAVPPWQWRWTAPGAPIDFFTLQAGLVPIHNPWVFAGGWSRGWHYTEPIPFGANYAITVAVATDPLPDRWGPLQATMYFEINISFFPLYAFSGRVEYHYPNAFVDHTIQIDKIFGGGPAHFDCLVEPIPYWIPHS